MKKPIIILSAIAALAIATLAPSEASACNHPNHSHCGQQRPTPRPRPVHPAIQVWVQETVAVTVADYQWVQTWTWNWSCAKLEYTWSRVQVGSHTEYQTRTVQKTAYWRSDWNSYAWYDSYGTAHPVSNATAWR